MYRPIYGQRRSSCTGGCRYNAAVASRSEAAPEDRRRATVRGLLLLLTQRGVAVAGGVVFTAVVPRLMGPADYGRYALLTSLTVWFVLMGGLGLGNVVIRYVPALDAREPQGLRALLGSMFVLRLAGGAVAAVVYLAVALVWLTDLGTAAPLFLAGSVLVQAVAGFVFATFLGLNRPGRWAAADGLRRWLAITLVVPGFTFGGLTGACAAVLVGDLVLLALGVWWGWSWVARLIFRLDLRAVVPYLRLGFAVYATQFLFAIVCASGEPIVRIVSGDYAEVGYFAIAHVMYLAGVAAVSQASLLFVPLLSDLLARGDTAGGTRFVERLLTWLMAAGVVGVFACFLLGDGVVTLLLGPGYGPVAANLLPLSVALLFVAFGSVSSTLGLVHERSRPIVVASSLRLAAFWMAAPPLVVDYGAWGAALAVAISGAAHAVSLGWAMRQALIGAMRAPVVSLALGALCAPAMGLRGGGMADLLLFAGLTAAYVVMVVRAGILSRADLATIIDALRAGPAEAGARGARASALP